MNKIEIMTQESYNTILSDAVKVLQNGGLVVAPTETQYGLLANASHSSALEKLYNAKQRPDFMPTAIFVNSIDEIFMYGESNERAKKLADEFLPGPLTLILSAKKSMEKYVVHNNKIGIRFSSSKLISDILSRINFPLTATSANISGKNDSASIDDIKSELLDSVALYIDGGNLTNSASTVVDVSEKEICFHRIGAISKEQINKIIES